MKYMYTAEETAQLRAKLIEDWVKPFAAACFKKYSQLQSIVLLVEYCNEWEHDAVYDEYIFSLLENPDWSAGLTSKYHLSTDLVNLPVFTCHDREEIDKVMRSLRSENQKVKLPHNYKLIWDEAGIAIPAFAAFCKNESPSKNNVKEDFVPYAILRRLGDDIEVEIIGKMWRPHQDGITPQSLRSFKEYEIKQIAKDCLEGDPSGDCAIRSSLTWSNTER